MAKNWYPVINTKTCVECGKCVEKCTHGVYDKGSQQKPVVVYPDGCVDQCHGCGNLCPTGSIKYEGEKGNPKNNYKRSEQTMKNLLIEWRHLDVEGETCDRCYDTGENLAAEVKRLNRALSPKGIEIKYIEIKLNEDKIDESNGILFNNVPIENILDIEVSRNYCGSCSDLVGKTTYCRTIKFDGNEYEDVPAKAIRQAAYKILGLDAETPPNSACCTDEGDCGCGGEEPVRTISIYEPAMCCPTGICGVGVDPELLRISAALETLKTCDTKIEVNRYNLTNAPEEFVKNVAVNKLLMDEGVDVLPIVVVDGKIVMIKRYPRNDEIENLLDITCDCLHGACPADVDYSCGCEGSCC